MFDQPKLCALPGCRLPIGHRDTRRSYCSPDHIAAAAGARRAAGPAGPPGCWDPAAARVLVDGAAPAAAGAPRHRLLADPPDPRPEPGGEPAAPPAPATPTGPATERSTGHRSPGRLRRARDRMARNRMATAPAGSVATV